MSRSVLDNLNHAVRTASAIKSAITKCPSCGGKGTGVSPGVPKKIATYKCPDCKGTGKVAPIEGRLASPKGRLDVFREAAKHF
jgi:DnaJ-class molecular chaperone